MMDIKNAPPIENLRELARARSRAEPDAGGASAPRPPAAGADQVTLTGAARSLLALHGPAGDAPVDSSRVAALRAAIADGAYVVDTDRIAQRLAQAENTR